MKLVPAAFLLLLVFAASGICQTAAADQLQRYSEEGEKALAEKRYGEAEAAYEKLRQLSPGTAEVHARLGLIYFQQGKFADAASALRRGLKLKPALPNADVLLAMSQAELGEFQEAVPALQKAFQRLADPALKRMAGLQLQRAYTALQQDEKAVEVALKLTQLYPNDPEVLYHTGRIFGNFAYLSIRKLSQVAPSSVWRYQAAGEAFESQGNAELAAVAYRQVLAIDPNRPGIHYRLGRVLLSSDREQALKEFERELQLDPTNANAAYELGDIQRKSHNPEKARDLFEQALKYYPDFEEAQIGLGRVFLMLAKPDLALSHLKESLRLNPENEVTYFHLSRAYRELGNTAEQQKALDAYRRLQSRKASQEQTLLTKPAAGPDVTRQEADGDAKPYK